MVLINRSSPGGQARESTSSCPVTVDTLRGIACRMIAPFRGTSPRIDPTVFLAAGAVVIGDVVIGAESSLWFHAVVRGDVYPIRIGRRTNVQDHATLHVLSGRAATTVGDDV